MKYLLVFLITFNVMAKVNEPEQTYDVAIRIFKCGKMTDFMYTPSRSGMVIVNIKPNDKITSTIESHYLMALKNRLVFDIEYACK